MQDEIIKHTRKAYEKMKDTEHSLWHKTKEIFIEIVIIVFAVTLSIWLHSWSEQRHQQNEAQDFLSDLKDDLSNDIDSMQTAQTAPKKNRESIAFILLLTESKLDSMIKTKSSLEFQSNIGTTKINNGNYEGFKSSGKIGFIENKKLKKYILNYYQDATPNLIEAEKINASLILKVSDYWTDNADQNIMKIILNPKLRYMLSVFLNTSKSTLSLYQDAITTARKIMTEIDRARDKNGT